MRNVNDPGSNSDNNFQNYDYYDYGYAQKKKPNVLLITLIITACIAIVAVVATVIIISGSMAAVPPELTITSCPEQITSEDPFVTISGTIYDDKHPCVLTINGETVETAMTPGSVKNFNKTYELSEGETKTFKITLKNNKDMSVSETKTVYCQKLEKIIATPEPVKVTGPLTSGCEFVKKKTGGLNIREYAGTDYDVIDYIDDYDYTSTMVFTGSYSVDDEGYTWYRVISPNGKYGYVRSDLVKRIS